MHDVLVIGGGNAALMAREAGASVLLLESAAREWRGGNSQHTRNPRCMYEAPQEVLKVAGGMTNEKLARLVIRASSTCRGWMRKHGVRFQPSLAGTRHLSRTTVFSWVAERRRLMPITAAGRGWACRYGTGRITAKSCVLAASGFESNLAWMREAWDQNERGEWPADNFVFRGTRFSQGVLLKFMMDAGADMIGGLSQSHCVAVDARAPLYDGGCWSRR